jgi:hypothetical protein
MALKLLITAREFNELPEQLKPEYLPKGEGYGLNVVGKAPDTAAAELELSQVRQELARANADVVGLTQKLETSSKDIEAKSADAIKKLQADNTRLRAAQISAALSAEVSALSGKFKAPTMAAAMLEKQIKVAYDDAGVLTTTYMGFDGKALDKAAFHQQVLDHAEFKPLLAAPASSGTIPANGVTPPTVPAVGQQPARRVSQMTSKELSAHLAKAKSDAGANLTN